MSTSDKWGLLGIAVVLGVAACEWLVRRFLHRRAIRQMVCDDLYDNTVLFTAKHPDMPEAHFACLYFGRAAGVPVYTIAEDIRAAVRLRRQPHAPAISNDPSAGSSAAHPR